MSGGAYDYSYQRVMDFVGHLVQGVTSDGDRIEPSVRERRCKFVAHLELVAEAMRAIEWVDSGDSGTDAERRAIEAVLGRPETVPIAEVKDAMDRTRDVLAALKGVVREPILNDLRYVLDTLMGIYEDRDKV